MLEKRKQIIISEIKYWRRNGLLPENYCDFLITLYAQGEDEEDDEKEKEKAVLLRERQQTKRRSWFIVITLLLLSVALFIASAYPLVVVIVAAVVLLVLLVTALRLATSKSALLPMLYIGSSYIILLTSLFIWYTFFTTYPMVLIGLLLLNCALWLFVGRLLKLIYFTISGAVGIITIVGFLLFQFS